MLTVSILAACASQPVELPNWDLAERDQTKQAADPLELPVLCSMPWDYSDVECWAALEQFDIVAEGNTEIAADNAAASLAGDQAYDELLGAAKIQQELSQIRQELLEKERRDHAIDNWWHRGLIVLIGIGIAL